MKIRDFVTLVAKMKYLGRKLLQEFYLSYRFVWRDLSATVIPNLILTVAALKFKEVSRLPEIVTALARTILYFWLYIYGFCLANQIAGVEEDRINKPDRPLSAGLVTYRGAQQRWVVVMILFAFVGWYYGILKWAILWQACIILHNFYNWSKHWFTKNGVIMPVGLVALMAPAWELVTPLTPVMWRWIIILAIVVGVTINLQDLRDMPGDRLMGRKTLPLTLGEKNARIALCVSFLLLAVAIHFGLMMPAGHTWKVLLCDLFLAAMDVTIAVRIIMSKSSRMDHKTYMMYTYWYCCVMGSAIFVL
jgi:4-hydroxybenzoate polyprenyltransferase